MRGYLFKAKRVDNGEEVIGSLVQGIAHDKECAIIVPKSELFSMIGTSFCDECNRHYDIDYEVIPETVRQFTGLTDKNGKLIFEGDILTTDEGYIYNICFEDGCYKVTFNGNEIIKPTQFAFDYMQLEVIGNIHDNKELLEVEE